MSNRSKKSNTVSPEQAIVEGFFKGVWSILKWLFGSAGGKKKKPTNKAQLEALQTHWEEVELHVLQAETRSHAISEADKILDNAFKVIGLPGATMGDRLKAAEPQFEQELYNRIWQAHKLRNTLAHEVGAKATAQEAEQAISTFRQALYRLGVLS